MDYFDCVLTGLYQSFTGQQYTRGIDFEILMFYTVLKPLDPIWQKILSNCCSSPPLEAGPYDSLFLKLSSTYVVEPCISFKLSTENANKFGDIPFVNF